MQCAFMDGLAAAIFCIATRIPRGCVCFESLHGLFARTIAMLIPSVLFFCSSSSSSSSRSSSSSSSRSTVDGQNPA